MEGDVAIVPDSARVVHHVPGRMRLRFDRGVNVGSAADRLRSSLAEHTGIQAVEPRPQSNSVIVRYDAAVMDIQRMLDEGFPAAAVELLEAVPPAIARVASGTAVGRVVVKAVDRANTRLDRATGGLLDFRDVLPLSLFGLSIRRLVQAGFEPVPWYNLLYYSFSTFSMLHGEAPAHHNHPEPDALEILRQRFARGEISRTEYREMLAELQRPAEVVQAETTSVTETPTPGEEGQHRRRQTRRAKEP